MDQFRCCSVDECNMSADNGSDYEVNSQTLDELFKEQLVSLRDLILKQSHIGDVELCRKWLKVFATTSKQEKLARNCLSSLMHEQLRDLGHLDAPFTNLCNCNRDLERVLAELDNPSESGTETPRINLQEELQMHSERRLFGADINTLTECHENETKAENATMRHELDMVRLQLTELRIENTRLKDIAAQCQLDNTKFLETIDSFKSMLLEAIGASLTRIENSEQQVPFRIFTNIFAEFDSGPEFAKIIDGFDARYQTMLNKVFERQLNERKAAIARHVCDKLAKNKTKIREKYHRRLRMQKFGHRLQLKLVKLKCFSVLRQIFINSQHGADETIWKLLKVLEEKYQTVVNEVT